MTLIVSHWWINVKLHKSVHCSTASPLSFVGGVSPGGAVAVEVFQSQYVVGFSVLVLVVQISRLVLYTECIVLHASQLKQYNVILLPYRCAFHLQVTSDENSATILDVGSLSYDCHSSYLRNC